MKQLFANAATSILAASISDTDLTIEVATGFGALFPNPGADEYFMVTLVNASGDREHVKITARVADLLTVPTGGRGQEGSSAQSWTNTLTRVDNRLTKGTLENFIQRQGDAMSGDLDMATHELKNAKLTGTTVVTGGQTVGTKLRGALNDASNEIDIPNDGSRATAGGAAILVEGDNARVRASAFVVGQIIMWYGSLPSVPAGWKLCNGANGTPDLRNRFVVGAGDTYALSATGGAVQTGTGTTSSNGSHHHDGPPSGDHILTTDEIPGHIHPLRVCTNGSGSTHNFDQASGIAGDTDTQGYYTKNSGNTGSDLMQGAGGGLAHSHPGGGLTSDDGDHTHDVPALSCLPPYFGLYFIMYTG